VPIGIVWRAMIRGALVKLYLQVFVFVLKIFDQSCWAVSHYAIDFIIYGFFEVNRVVKNPLNHWNSSCLHMLDKEEVHTLKARKAAFGDEFHTCIEFDGRLSSWVLHFYCIFGTGIDIEIHGHKG